jgi:hypothetical protein
MEEQEPLNQLNIELSEDIADGIYSNLVIIAHSNAEFILDFVKVLPGLPKAKVKTRVIMTPQHAKRLLLALQDNLQKYEGMFGNIELHEDQHMLPPINFGGGPAGMA